MHLKTEIIIILCNQVVNSFAVALSKSIPNSMQPLVVWFCLAFSLASLLLVVVFLLWRRFVVSLCALLEDETTKQQSNSNTQNRKHQNNERSNKRTTTTTTIKRQTTNSVNVLTLFFALFFCLFRNECPAKRERERERLKARKWRRKTRETQYRNASARRGNNKCGKCGKRQVASGNWREESGEWRQAAQRAGKPNLPELPLEQ